MKSDVVWMLGLGILALVFMGSFVVTLWKYLDARRVSAYLIERDIKAQDARHDHQYRCEICHKTPES